MAGQSFAHGEVTARVFCVQLLGAHSGFQEESRMCQLDPFASLRHTRIAVSLLFFVTLTRRRWLVGLRQRRGGCCDCVPHTVLVGCYCSTFGRHVDAGSMTSVL